MVAPLIIAALIGGAASLVSGFIGAGAADKASKTEAAAADKALGVQVGATQQARIDAYPWALQGAQSLYAYMDELGIPRPQTPILPDLTKGPFGTNTAAGGTSGGGAGGRGGGTSATAAPDAWTGGIGAPGSIPMTAKKGFQETPGYQFQVSQGEKSITNNMAALGMKNSGAALKALSTFRQGLADQSYGTWLNRLADSAGMGQTQVNSTNALTASGANSAANTIQQGGAARASGYVGGANAWTSALGNFSNNMGSALGGYDQNWNKVV